MRILGAIVEPFVLAMFEIHAHVVARRGVGTELVGNQNAGSARLFADELAQKPLRRSAISSALNQRVDDEAVLIDGSPKPVFLAIDRDNDLIQMPLIAQLRRASADTISEISSKLLAPTPHGFMADDNVTRRQKVFDHSQTRRKSIIQLHRVGDDLGGETMAPIKRILDGAHRA